MDEKVPTESYIEGAMIPGCDVTVLYTIEGHDTTSMNRSLFYIDMNQYNEEM